MNASFCFHGKVPKLRCFRIQLHWTRGDIAETRATLPLPLGQRGYTMEPRTLFQWFGGGAQLTFRKSLFPWLPLLKRQFGLFGTGLAQVRT